MKNNNNTFCCPFLWEGEKGCDRVGGGLFPLPHIKIFKTGIKIDS
jgi:hypothetical protein